MVNSMKWHDPPSVDNSWLTGWSEHSVIVSAHTQQCVPGVCTGALSRLCKLSPLSGEDCQFSANVPVVCRRRCCISWCVCAALAPSAQRSRPPRCVSSSALACAWPPEESCRELGASRRAERLVSLRRYEPRETPPETKQRITGGSRQWSGFSSDTNSN